MRSQHFNPGSKGDQVSLPGRAAKVCALSQKISQKCDI